MTGIEFLAAGVKVEKDQASEQLIVWGPRGRGDLLEDLRFEVLTRVMLVRDRIAETARTPWGCVYCGDGVGHGHDGSKQTDGWCILCALARQKAGDVGMGAA